MGREIVHYEAPAARLLAGEMSRFINWANQPDDPAGGRSTSYSLKDMDK